MLGDCREGKAECFPERRIAEDVSFFEHRQLIASEGRALETSFHQTELELNEGEGDVQLPSPLAL